MIKLSILILTIPAREHMLTGLIQRLRPQITGKPAEVLLHRNAKMSIGAKRNALLRRAEGEYVVFIDDDDMVPSNYVERILEATQSSPDCVGISGVIVANGKEKKWHISREYARWHEKDNVYYRTPNHISPVKRKIAMQAMFPETNYGEDAEYSRRILPLLKTEVKIEGPMYTYRYNKKKIA